MIFVYCIIAVVLLLIIFTIVAGKVAFSITPKPSNVTPESLGLTFRDIYFSNSDHDVLHGWWIPHQDASDANPCPSVIIVHGWNRNCERMLPYLDHIKDLQMNILMIEARGHGENRPNPFISQVGFGRDIISAVDWIVLQPESDIQRIGVFGHSVGAAATIFAAAFDKRITAFVADASYAHPRDIIMQGLQEYHLPYLPFGFILQHYIQMRIGMTLNSAAPEKLIRKISVPGLLIHGTADEVIPIDNLERIRSRAKSNISLWIAEGLRHSNTPEHPQFGKVVRGFFRSALQLEDTATNPLFDDHTQMPSMN